MSEWTRARRQAGRERFRGNSNPEWAVARKGPTGRGGKQGQTEPPDRPPPVPVKQQLKINKILLQSTGKDIQYPGINHNERNIKKKVCMCRTESLCQTAEMIPTL